MAGGRVLRVHGPDDLRVLADLELMTTPWTRIRGVIGRPDLGGAVLLSPASAVHTVGVRFPLDVAFCTGDLTVIDTVQLRPGRFTAPRRRCRAVLEATAGSFDRWGVHPGVRLDVA